jgi:hypothetical protein
LAAFAILGRAKVVTGKAFFTGTLPLDYFELRERAFSFEDTRFVFIHFL